MTTSGSLPPGLDSLRALQAYDPAVGQSLVGLKNRDERGRIRALADGMARLVPADPHLVVTWVPTTPARRRERGFDQAELLARAVARRGGLPCRPLLARRRGPAQAGRDAADRWRHPGFRAAGRIGRSVLVVDDVATTGATLAAAAEALHRAGVASVHGLVVARAPRPGGE